MYKINGYEDSIKISQINNSRSVNLETNQGGHQQPMLLYQHVQHEDIKYTRDQILEIKQKVRENIFKIISPELCHNMKRLRINKRGRRV